MIWNLPNALTLARIALTPLILFLLGSYPKHAVLAAFLFSVISFTDYLDGKLARLLHKETRIGLFLDPFADKLLIVPTLFLLNYHGLLPFWLVGLLALRELLTIFFRRGVILPPSRFGKAKMVCEVLGIVMLLLGITIPVFGSRIAGFHVLFAALIFAYISLAQYARIIWGAQ